MPPGPNDLFQAVKQFLDACVKSLVDVGITPPGYQAIWTGLPAFDCVPALSVHLGGPHVGDTYPLQPPLQPMQRIATTGQVNLLAMTCTIIRCWPVAEQQQQSLLLPSTQEITDASEETYNDLWAIWNGLKNQHRLGTLFQTRSGRREFLLDPAVPVNTSGGAAGWQIPIQVQLGGYS